VTASSRQVRFAPNHPTPPPHPPTHALRLPRGSITGHLGGASKSCVRRNEGCVSGHLTPLLSVWADTQEEDGMVNVARRHVTEPYHDTGPAPSSDDGVPPDVVKMLLLRCGEKARERYLGECRKESIPSQPDDTLGTWNHAPSTSEKCEMLTLLSFSTRVTVAAYVYCCGTQVYARAYVVQYCGQ
jgi:hypothetical protein